jgi:hypothetical protein
MTLAGKSHLDGGWTLRLSRDELRDTVATCK